MPLTPRGQNPEEPNPDTGLTPPVPAPPPPPPPGARGPQLDWVDVFLIEFINAVAAMPWYFAVAGLAAHLAFVLAGGD